MTEATFGGKLTLRKLDDQILEAKIETGKIVGSVRSSGGRFEQVKNDLTQCSSRL